MRPFLEASKIIDWQHPEISALAQSLAQGTPDPVEIARRCFLWVRDEVQHSWDYRRGPVTCKASDVLAHRTGFCYAKSHLLAALLRANGIPAGLCYQRLSLDEGGKPYCLHGLNAVYLEPYGWYRVDARGNKAGVDAGFSPPEERLAFSLQDAQEADFPDILPAPLSCVAAALRQYTDIFELRQNLPDCEQISLMDTAS